VLWKMEFGFYYVVSNAEATIAFVDGSTKTHPLGLCKIKE